MAAFITDLMNSIFVPGPTHSLIVATNASFACLQLLLGALLIATYSVHFLVLSFLSAGLWWSINWFVHELAAARAAEETRKLAEAADAQNESDTDAETIRDSETIIDSGPGTTSGSKEVEPVQQMGELIDRGRTSGSQSTRSEPSTEDEWERVSENEKDK